MADDERVMVLGEDVQMLRRNLAVRFGLRRVRNTPISESAFLGAAVAAAMAGLRPIAEVMLIDFAGSRPGQQSRPSILWALLSPCNLVALRLGPGPHSRSWKSPSLASRGEGPARKALILLPNDARAVLWLQTTIGAGGTGAVRHPDRPGGRAGGRALSYPWVSMVAFSRRVNESFILSVAQSIRLRSGGMRQNDPAWCSIVSFVPDPSGSKP